MRYFRKNNGQIEFFNGILVQGNRQVINPSHERIIKAGWKEYTQPANTLEEVKADKIAEIEAYDSSDAVNSFSIGGVAMWIDYDERSRIRESIEIEKKRGKSSMVKIFLNTKFEYPIAVWEQMITALGGYAIDAKNATEGHKLAVSKLQSVEEVEKYDYKVGYPDKLTF